MKTILILSALFASLAAFAAGPVGEVSAEGAACPAISNDTSAKNVGVDTSKKEEKKEESATNVNKPRAAAKH